MVKGPVKCYLLSEVLPDPAGQSFFALDNHDSFTYSCCPHRALKISIYIFASSTLRTEIYFISSDLGELGTIINSITDKKTEAQKDYTSYPGSDNQ